MDNEEEESRSGFCSFFPPYHGSIQFRLRQGMEQEMLAVGIVLVFYIGINAYPWYYVCCCGDREGKEGGRDRFMSWWVRAIRLLWNLSFKVLVGILLDCFRFSPHIHNFNKNSELLYNSYVNHSIYFHRNTILNCEAMEVWARRKGGHDDSPQIIFTRWKL